MFLIFTGPDLAHLPIPALFNGFGRRAGGPSNWQGRCMEIGCHARARHEIQAAAARGTGRSLGLDRDHIRRRSRVGAGDPDLARGARDDRRAADRGQIWLNPLRIVPHPYMPISVFP